MLHKAVNEVYDYSWWKHSKYCYDIANDIEPYEPDGVSVRTACFEEKMGIIHNFQYILIRPQIGRNKFFQRRDSWGF